MREATNSKLSQKVKIRYKDGYMEAGFGCKTLVMAFVGANNARDYKTQIHKLNVLAQMENGPNIISDVSLFKPRKQKPLWMIVANETSIIAATVPIYTCRKEKGFLNSNYLLEVIEEQIQNGVGLITIHPTPNRKLFELAKYRLTPFTSRGGRIVIEDLIATQWQQENVYLKILPDLIKLARENKVALSIGASFRPANIFDAYDDAHREELDLQIQIAKTILSEGVGVIIEAPGHARTLSLKKIAHKLNSAGFPVMPLGPIPTDIALGMDHISGAIGATLFGLYGSAHILAAVTREEHTGNIPSIQSTVESVIASRIAAHIIDIHHLGDDSSDLVIAKKRAQCHSCTAQELSKCSRCGDYCPLNFKE